MADVTNLFGSLFGLSQIFSGASIASSAANAQAQAILTGGNIQASGAKLTAAGFRQSAESVREATAFNIQIDKMNTKRQLDAIARQSNRLLARQRVTAASSGIALTSKSFLQLQNEAIDTVQRQMTDFKVAAENSIRAKQFESSVRQVNLENQARAAEFQGEAAKVTAANRAAEARFQGEVAEFKAGQQFAKDLQYFQIF